jgi:hypothetical protein
MTRSEFDVEIVKRAEYWPITVDERETFARLAKECGSGKAVLDAWGTFKRGAGKNKRPELFFTWWDNHKPEPVGSVTEQPVEPVRQFEELPWRNK